MNQLFKLIVIELTRVVHWKLEPMGINTHFRASSGEQSIEIVALGDNRGVSVSIFYYPDDSNSNPNLKLTVIKTLNKAVEGHFSGYVITMVADEWLLDNVRKHYKVIYEV